MTLTSAVAHLAQCSTPEQEYWAHVSSQVELPIADGNEPSVLRAELDELADAYQEGDDHTLRDLLATSLLATPVLIEQLRLLVAVSDKRLYLDLSYVFSRQAHPTSARSTLCGCLPHDLKKHSTAFFMSMLSKSERGSAAARAAAVDAANAISEYLVNRGLNRVLGLYAGLTEDQRSILLANLVFPKEYQQNEAKRRGHGAEVLMALLMTAVGVVYVPADKRTNPMGSRDPNVDLGTMTIVGRGPGSFSCDLVATDDVGRVRACFQGLVQSSDPGQFGVEKATTTVTARALFDEYNATSDAPVKLWGIVDGVGYSENKAGTINRLLLAFHNLFQVKSAYKLPLALTELGLCRVEAIHFNEDFYSPEAAAYMASRYVPEGVRILEPNQNPDSSWTPVPAGAATLYVDRAATAAAAAAT